MVMPDIKDDLSKERRAFEFVNSILENTHSSLKWSWQIVMGFSLVTAVQQAYAALFDTAGLSDPALSFLLFLFIFIPTFVRLFYGDNRYLDLHYLELRRWNNKPEAYLHELRHQLSSHRRFIDIFLLLTHGELFIFLGKAIGKPEIFFAIYVALMIVNVLWLGLSVALNTRIRVVNFPSQVKSRLVGNDQRNTSTPRRDRSPRFWIKNNIFALLIFGSIYFLRMRGQIEEEAFFGLFIFTSLLNSGLDIVTQWGFYFPNLDEVYEDALQEDDNEAPNNRLQPDRGPLAVSAEAERTRLGRAAEGGRWAASEWAQSEWWATAIRRKKRWQSGTLS